MAGFVVQLILYSFLILGVIVIISKIVNNLKRKNKRNKEVILNSSNNITTKDDKYRNEIYLIKELVNSHFNKIYTMHNTTITIKERLSFIRNVLDQVAIPKIIEKMNQLHISGEKQAFTSGLADGKTIFYIELYPSTKCIVKETQFKNSYLDSLSYLWNMNSNKFNINSNNIEFFHIMFFINATNYEIDMGIIMPKYGYALYPFDLLSENDKKMLNQH